GDHLYGLGGVSFTGAAAGTNATFGTATEGDVGRQVSSFDIYYLAQPGGGDFDIAVDGSPVRSVSTAMDVARSRFARVQAPRGPHTLTIRAAGNGEVRLFGVVLESGPSGVQYDSLGVNGAFVGLLANYMDGEHWAEQIAHRNPDLVILNYGTNESQFERLPMDQYHRDTVEVIRRVRAALPHASIMLVAPMDRGARGEGGRILTRPPIPRLVSHQRAIAAETGCAFFDTYTAMGGDGTVARWCDARPKLMGGDYTHPTARGAEIVGNLIYNAIIRATTATGRLMLSHNRPFKWRMDDSIAQKGEPMLPQGVIAFLNNAATEGRTTLPDRDTSLFLSGVLDSFTLVEFVTVLEKECGIRVDDADLRPENFDTISKVEDF